MTHTVSSLDRAYLVEAWSGSTYVGAWHEMALVTQRTIRRQPVPHARLAELTDLPTVLDQAEVFNTYQPWWLRLTQTGRLGGVASPGMFVLVGVLLIAAALALRIALGGVVWKTARSPSGRKPIPVEVGRLEEPGGA